MPCAMSSLRGASGVVGCDRVVCPLVLHATTIAHLDVLLCTLLFFLLCAVLLRGAVSVVCPVPCLPCLWCGCVVLCLWCALCLACPACGVAAWCCVCGVRVRPNPALPAPVGVCYGVPCTPCVLPALFSWGNTCPIYGGAICGPCTLPIYVPYFF